MEEGVSERKYDKKKKNDEEKEAELSYNTPPESTTMDGGKGVNNEKVGEDVDLDEWNESTCYDDKYYGKEAEFPDGTTPDDMEEGVSEKKDDKNERIDEEKEAACADGTSPDDMEEGVGEKKMTRMSELMRKKGKHPQTALLLMIRRKV